MPTVEDFKKSSTELLDEINLYQSQTHLANPYKILGLLADILGTSAVLIMPVLKVPGSILQISSKILNAYLKYKNEKIR